MSQQQAADAPAPVQYVDWSLARATGRRLAPPGPKVAPHEARTIVADLRDAAAQAVGPVAHTARMDAGSGGPAVLVVDRPGWVTANASSFEALLAPFVESISTQTPAAPKAGASSAATAIGAKIAGAEAGSLLAFLSTKVLGQYDLAPAGTPRLLLVAPNIVEAERSMGVKPRDFRLWVALHEETHRVQFTAVPWLRQHMIDQTAELSRSLAPNPDDLAERLRGITSRLTDTVREGSTGLSELFTTAEQREHIARLTAVMSLLEGHADVVMDDVGPAIVPTVEQIRAKFTERRAGAGSLDRLLRRLLGMEAKLNQYRAGASFVRGVVAKVGIDDFNAIWAAPDTLPLPDEIESPERWVARVHGR